MTQIRKVRGTSLSGIVEEGDSLKILFGFYRCNPLKRGEIAVYNYAGSKIPLVKVIRAIPGDTFHIRCENGKCHILVNGSEVKNNGGALYYMTEKESALLKYYESSYKGIIPEKTCLILGNRNGTIDSGKFGLVGMEDILGKGETFFRNK